MHCYTPLIVNPDLANPDAHNSVMSLRSALNLFRPFRCAFFWFEPVVVILASSILFRSIDAVKDLLNVVKERHRCGETMPT
jgi:hypothetical protein